MGRKGTALAEAPNLRFFDPKTFKERADSGQEPDSLGVRKHYSAGVEKDPQGEDRVLQFTISTGSVDRDNDTIDPHGWDLTNYNKNGVVLWAHDYHEPPIARALATWVEDDALKSRAKFPERDLYPFADMIYRMYHEGYMRAVSVGFVPKKWTRNEERAGYAVDFVEQELLEYSAVPVPANPEALLEAKSAGIDVAPMVEWAEKVLDGAAGEKGLWLPRKDVETLYSALKDGCKHISLPPDPKAVGDAAGGGDGKEVIATVRLYDDGTIDVVDMRNVREAMEDLSDAQKQILSVATKSEDDVTEKESVFDVERMAAEFGQVLERIEQLLKEKLPGGMNVNVIAEADDKTTDTNHADDGDDEYVFQLVEEGAGDKEDDEVNIDPEQLASVVREIVQEEFRRATGRLD